MGAMKRLLDKILNGEELTPEERVIAENATTSAWYIEMAGRHVQAQAQVGIEETNHE